MRRPTALLLLMVAGFSPAAWAQQTFELQPNLITLRPAAESIPALKYRLVRERITLVPGNAAISYYRANIFLTEIRSALTAREKMEPVAKLDRFDEQTLHNWNSGPIADIPTEKARKHLERCKDVLNEVELGALRSTCDWELDERREGISLLLPEMQQMRSLGRLVTLRARLAILDRKTDEAIHWIETGLVMGRHISQGPVVIQALVGISVDSMMVRCLEDLIQSADCSNLYWALADRPRPFIDIRRAMEGERYRVETMLPEVRELDTGPWSIEKAQRFVHELERKLDPLAPGFLTPNENVPKELRELGNGDRRRRNRRQDLPSCQTRTNRPRSYRGPSRRHAHHQDRCALYLSGISAQARRFRQVAERPLWAVLSPDRPGWSLYRGGKVRQSAPRDDPASDGISRFGPSRRCGA
jgi:hypothetical protein